MRMVFVCGIAALVATQITTAAGEPTIEVVALLDQCKHDCTKPPDEALRERQSCIREAAKNMDYDTLVDAVRRSGMAAFPAGGRKPQCGGYVAPDKFEPGNKVRMWMPSFDVDPMDDRRQCTMQPRVGMEPASPFVYLDRNGWGIVLSGDDYPGEPMKIRIDKRAAHVSASHTGFSGGNANSVIADMRAGAAVKTEMIEWPGGAPIYWSGSLEGFGIAADECKAWVSKGIAP